LKAWVGEGAAKAVRYSLTELPVPAAAPDEVVLRVKAVALNLVDRFPKRAHFAHSSELPAAVPGLEAAGEIAALGSEVRNWRAGDRVMAMLHGGCAQSACAKAALLMPVPAGMSWTDAAALPVSFLTAYDALVLNGRLRSGESVLVQGVTTGVGLAAVQLARRHGAALIAGSSRSAEKLERTRALGLDIGADGVMEATAGRGVDLVVDHLGGRVLNETLRVTAIGGRIVNVGRFAGTRGEIDLEVLALRRLTLIGVTFRTRTLEEHAAIVGSFLASHAADLAAGTLRAVVDRVYDFAALPDAVARAASGEQFGKLVLEL
jgi:NADPH:quinone reductase